MASCRKNGGADMVHTSSHMRISFHRSVFCLMLTRPRFLMGLCGWSFIPRRKLLRRYPPVANLPRIRRKWMVSESRSRIVSAVTTRDRLGDAKAEAHGAVLRNWLPKSLVILRAI